MTRLCEISLEAGTQAMVSLTSNRFVWYELLTTNVIGAKAFYANVVGWGARDVSIPGAAYNLFTSGDTPVTAVMNLPQEMRRAGAMPCWMGSRWYLGLRSGPRIPRRLLCYELARAIPPP